MPIPKKAGAWGIVRQAGVCGVSGLQPELYKGGCQLCLVPKAVPGFTLAMIRALVDSGCVG